MINNEQLELFPKQSLRPEEIESLDKVLRRGFSVTITANAVTITPSHWDYCRNQSICEPTFEEAYLKYTQTKFKMHNWDTTFYDPCGRNEYTCTRCGATR